MPSTSIFQAGLARPPTMSVLAGLRSPSTLLRPSRAAARSPWFGRMVVILTRLSKVMPAALSCASRFCQARRLCSTISSGRLIPLAPADQHLVGGGLEGEAEPEETVEGRGGIVAAVEPEHELVEV